MRHDKLNLSIRKVAPMISQGRVSPVELVELTLDRIRELNPKLNAYITVLGAEALREAELAEREISNGRYRGPLHGVPVGIKDIICVKNVRCTAGSKILARQVSTYDATVISKLRRAGAIIAGTQNLHEFASGVTSDNPHYGTARNPWNLDRIPGGSSGGSAAAVSCGLAFASLGTDTGGSIRNPASLCGVVGLKPTFGIVSRFGVLPASWSLDHVGVLARCSWDAAKVLEAVAGYDPRDDGSSRSRSDVNVDRPPRPVSKIRVGVPSNYFLNNLDPEVEHAFSRFLRRLSDMGAEQVQVNVQDVEKIYEQWGAVRWGEGASIHKQWIDKRPQDYGADVRRMLERGRRFTLAEYLDAIRTWKEIRKSMLMLFRSIDLLATPTTCVVAPRIGEETLMLNGKSVEIYYALTRLTLPFNATGFPALSMPVQLSTGGLPIGVQLVGRPFAESTLLSFADSYERKHGVSMIPPL